MRLRMSWIQRTLSWLQHLLSHIQHLRHSWIQSFILPSVLTPGLPLSWDVSVAGPVAFQVLVQVGSTALQREARGQPPMQNILLASADQISTNCEPPMSAASQT